MTENRKEELCAAISKNQEAAKKLLFMAPEEVAAYLTGEGYDFTVEEIKELGAEVQEQIDARKDGELDEEALANVAGGRDTHALYFAAGMATVAIGVGIVCCGW